MPSIATPPSWSNGTRPSARPPTCTSRAWVVEAQEGAAAALERLGAVYSQLGSHRRLLLDGSGAAPWLARFWRSPSVITSGPGGSSGSPSNWRRTTQSFGGRGGGRPRPWPARPGCVRPRKSRGHPPVSVVPHVGARGRWCSPRRGRPVGLGAGSPRTSTRGLRAVRRPPGCRRVQAHLGQVGAKRRRVSGVTRSVSGWASLTAAEQTVAGFVALGLTNRMVAERMYLSHHTVDFHLRQIFRKLGVHSRVELTRLAFEAGAVARPTIDD